VPEPSATFEPSPRRVRAVIDGVTVADSVRAALLLETGSRPVYYFPREDVQGGRLERSTHRAQSATKGEATFWTLIVGNRRLEQALWGHETPPAALAPMTGYLAFAADKVDHWYEEDEEVFGHPNDPYHRVDVRPSVRRVRVRLDGETIADTRRALFLFETGHPTRYYIPPEDVRTELLTPTERHTVCPYKGRASYWSIRLGERVVADAVWGYLDPVPECPRIKGLMCFYPEKVGAIEVEAPSAVPDRAAP
jgi:uncharacterized protein (DUF427 family)